MKQCLIHLHPTFVDFTQSVMVVKKLYGITTFKYIDGPSLQSKSVVSEFAERLDELSGLFKECGLSISRKKTSFGIRAFAAALRRMQRRDLIQIARLKDIGLRYAARDSIMRKPMSYWYLISPGMVRYLFELVHYMRGALLISIYKELLATDRPSVVISSHSTYIPYVALLRAANSLDITVVCHDVRRTSVIEGYMDFYHNNTELANAAHKYSEFMDFAGKARELTVDKRSFYAKASKDMSASKDKKLSGRALVLLPHCIKDANFTCNGTEMLYDNYFDWIVSTVYILVTRRSHYERIVFKIHPHARLFQDYILLYLLGLALRIGRIRRCVLVGEKIDTSRILSGYNMVPVTCHGSVSYENGSIGICTLAVGEAPAPPKCVVRPKDKEEYKSMLVCPSRFEKKVEINKDAVSKAKAQTDILSIMEMPAEINMEYNSYFKSVFYFGIIDSNKKPVTNKALVENLRRFYDSFEVKKVSISQSMSFIAYRTKASKEK